MYKDLPKDIVARMHARAKIKEQDTRYTIDYNCIIDDETGGLLIKINEVVEYGDAYSDEICVDKETNSLWVSRNFDYDSELTFTNHDLEEWFREVFKKRDSVKGLIRREMININR